MFWWFRSISCVCVYVVFLAGRSTDTFTAIIDLGWFNYSCLKSPASTLVDLIFQSRMLRSFSLNQLRDLSLLAGNLYSSFSISSWSFLYPFYSLLCLHCDIMNLCLSLCSEGEWAVSGCSLRGAVKKFSEILCWRRMRDKIAHAVMWWWA